MRELLGGKADTLDAFDVPQLACVIRLCRSSSTLSEAGRRLFAASRLTKATSNDADRLRKYLANYDGEADEQSVAIAEGADANGDGFVDGRDVIRLRKYLANYDSETGSSTVTLGPSE